MTSPHPEHESRPLVPLASLLDTSLSDPFGLCPLRPTEVTSLRKLASLWNRIVEQFLPLAERNRERLGPIYDRLNADGFVSHKPFLAEWPLLALTSQTLREKGSPDAGEVRNLLNGLHESALLASLLGSFGIGPFTSRAFSKVEAALTPESSLPAYAARFYRHRLTIDALNNVLRDADIPIVLPDASNKSSLADIRSALARFIPNAPQHSKEQLLVEAACHQATRSLSGKILIATGEGHVMYLTGRLTRSLSGLPRGYVVNLGRGLGDSTLSAHSHDARIIVAPMRHLASIPPTEISQILLYSPLSVGDLRLELVTRNSLNALRSAFPNIPLHVLRTSSEEFEVDRIIYERALASTVRQESEVRGHESSPRMSGSAAVPPPSSGNFKRGSTIEVTLPKTQQGTLFDSTALDALVPPPQPSHARPLPTVDPGSLPTTSEELNARLGISLIKPALVPRPDQLQRLFEMLQEPSFQWLIKANTGFGKTALASIIMATRLGHSSLTPAECRRGFRIAYVTPNVDLCSQAKAEFLRFLDLSSAEIGILHGKVPLRERGEIMSDLSTKIIVSTPETLLKTVPHLDSHLGYDSFALMVVDEFQSAEGEHPMARLVRTAREAGVPILPQSGTPARDEQDLAEKRALLPLHGALVPETLQPLKNHDLLSSFLEPQLTRLADDLATFSYTPYLSTRQHIKNAEHLIKQLIGAEPPMLFESELTIGRRPHIESFDHPSSRLFKKLKAQTLELRSKLKEIESGFRDRGEPLSEIARNARTRLNLASINIARMSSITSRSSLLTHAGAYAFLHDFAVTWISRYLESPRREGAFPAFQDFFRDPEFRGVVRAVAEGTPFVHLLQSPTCREALEKAFAIPADRVPASPAHRRALFLNLAMDDMSRRALLDHPKERRLFDRIEELHRQGQARGLIIFAEPRHLTKFLALRLQHRFAAKGLRVAFVTGEGDGFADRLAHHLHAQKEGFTPLRSSTLGSWEDIRAAFQRSPTEPGDRVDIIVATSRLSVGHNLSAAAEAHIYTMHADAQKLIQQIGRVGRPDGNDFFGRVGQCFYHVTRNTSEWYLFLSAIRKYKWMRDSLVTSESWEGSSDSQVATRGESARDA